MGDIQIFVDDRRRWHIGPRDQFIGATAQKLQHRLVQTIHLPFFAKFAINQHIDFRATGINARHNVIEEIGVGICILRIFDFLPQTVRVEFVQ